LKQNNDFVTYPKAIIKAENLNEMAARKRLDGRKESLEFVWLQGRAPS
jgi:hypothetical protein